MWNTRKGYCRKDTCEPMSMHMAMHMHRSVVCIRPLQAKWLASDAHHPSLHHPLSIDQLTSRSLTRAHTHTLNAGRRLHLDRILRYSPLIAWAGLLFVPVQAATKQAGALWTPRAMRGTLPLFPKNPCKSGRLEGLPPAAPRQCGRLPILLPPLYSLLPRGQHGWPPPSTED